MLISRDTALLDLDQWAMPMAMALSRRNSSWLKNGHMLKIGVIRLYVRKINSPKPTHPGVMHISF